ncbi:MAG TPA: lantibiotic dehydratase [Pyrinomonadaceae bacterium]|nr:lantibiotic dehydratase [Pyrinomonadaceae bacterium]
MNDNGTSLAEDLREQSHVISIDNGKWTMWRWVCLRGAGFPVEQVIKLSNPDAASAADKILEAEALESEARQVALQAARNALEVAASDERGRANKLMHRLRMGKRINQVPSGYAAEPVERLRSATEQVDTAWTNFREIFQAGSAVVSQAVREIASDDNFREALVWQNRNVANYANPLLDSPANQTSGASAQRARIVAKYLQRYCTKNDTIGFFGPVGWMRLVPEGEPIAVRPGPQIVAARNVYFEVWGIDTLAETLAQDPSFKYWTAPRPMSYLSLVGTSLLLPARAPVKLSSKQAAVLNACDGELSAREIARSLLRNTSLGFSNEAEIFQILEQMRESGFIVWNLEMPIELHPERTLRRILERIDDDNLRSKSLATLNELEDRRSEVEAAAGDPAKLELALGNLDATFTRLTGASPTRSAGKMYAARTLIYQDCRRDIEIEMGSEMIAALADPLSLLLTSVRWFTFNVAAFYKQLFRETYSEIAKRANTRTIDFATFWYRIYPHIFGDKKEIEKVLAILQEQWARILAVPPDVRRVSYRSEELRAAVLKAFAAPSSGWKSAIYHSPDVMIAASSVEEIRRGNFSFVLGEMHIQINTLRQTVFYTQHPEPAELINYYDRDHTRTRAVPLIPTSLWPSKGVRVLPTLTGTSDYRIQFNPDPHTSPREKVLPFGSLVVEPDGDELIARTRDGRVRFDILDIFSDTPILSIGNSFKILSSANYQPRITIDRLVVCRESWTFAPADLKFALEKTDTERFVAARRWARGLGIPRFAFFKSSSERKPLFVDFDSPLYVDHFAAAVRNCEDNGSGKQQISVSEMLPTIDQVWLPDANDRRYTSELRMVIVDRP